MIRAFGNVRGITNQPPGLLVGLGSGNAEPGEVLAGKRYTNDRGQQLGTMPDRGAVTPTITTQNGEYTIPAGYHNGSGKVTAAFANLTTNNVRSGVNIGGVVGSLIEGKRSASGNTNNGTGLHTGTKPNNTTTSLSFYYVEVTGLTFTPSFVLMYSGSFYTLFDVRVTDNEILAVSNRINTDGYIAQNAFTLMTDFNFKVTSGGFKLPVGDISGTVRSYTWIAIE